MQCYYKICKHKNFCVYIFYKLTWLIQVGIMILWLRYDVMTKLSLLKMRRYVTIAKNIK